MAWAAQARPAARVANFRLAAFRDFDIIVLSTVQGCFGTVRDCRRSRRRQRVERPHMLDLPAQRNHITDAQRRVQLGDRLLDEEVVAAANLQAHTHVVAR